MSPSFGNTNNYDAEINLRITNNLHDIILCLYFCTVTRSHTQYIIVYSVIDGTGRLIIYLACVRNNSHKKHWFVFINQLVTVKQLFLVHVAECLLCRLYIEALAKRAFSMVLDDLRDRLFLVTL